VPPARDHRVAGRSMCGGVRVGVCTLVVGRTGVLGSGAGWGGGGLVAVAVQDDD